MQRIETGFTDPVNESNLPQIDGNSEIKKSPSIFSKQSTLEKNDDEIVSQNQSEEQHDGAEQETEQGLKMCRACGKYSEQMDKCLICKTQFKLKWFEFRPSPFSISIFSMHNNIQYGFSL